MMGRWSIGEVAERVGVATSTIRYYEEVGLLPEAARLNGRRRYDSTILDKLNVIRLAQQAGFTIAEIKMLLHDFPVGTPPSERWEVMANRKLVEIDEQIKTMGRMKAMLFHTLTCQCGSLEECGRGIDD
jgi:MerR family redox-sensitive transcriptional activator SoxR